MTSGTTAEDGSILLAGVTADHPAVWRIDPAGALDLAWGDDGVRLHPIDHAGYSVLAPTAGAGYLAGGSVSSDSAANDHFAEMSERIVALAERPELRVLALVEYELGRHTALVRYWR